MCFLSPEITEEPGGPGQRRPGRGPRESVASIATLASERESERELLQRNRDISVTFGYGETGSTQDLRCKQDTQSRVRIAFIVLHGALENEH